MDSKILENRLVLKESSFVGSSVSKCAAKLQSLTTAKQDVTSFDSFVREVLQYKLDIAKVDHIHCSHDRQMEAYNATEQDINEKIKEIEGTIFDLETQFKNAKSIRLHREQLEKKAAGVNSLPSQNQLKRKLDQLHNNIFDTETSLSAMNTRISVRYNQFGNLLKCITDLQSKLIEENEGVEEGDATEAAGGADLDDGDDEVVRTRDEREDEVEQKTETKPDYEVEEENDPQNEIVVSFEEEEQQPLS